MPRIGAESLYREFQSAVDAQAIVLAAKKLRTIKSLVGGPEFLKDHKQEIIDKTGENPAISFIIDQSRSAVFNQNLDAFRLKGVKQIFE